MTPELQRYYEEVLATMATPGWALILEDFEQMRKAYADVRNCENLDLAKGRLDILDLLAGWKAATEKAYEELSAEVDAA